MEDQTIYKGTFSISKDGKSTIEASGNINDLVTMFSDKTSEIVEKVRTARAKADKIYQN